MKRRLLPILILAVIVLIAGGFMLKTYLALQSNVVFFDNTNDYAVQLFLNGAYHSTIEKGQTVVLELEPQTYQMTAQGPSGEIEQGAFIVQNVDSGGFRALYSLGGKRQYVVVKALYNAAGGNTEVIPVMFNQSYAILPSNVAPDGIDLTFPQSMPGESAELVYLCHFDPTTNAIGCPNT